MKPEPGRLRQSLPPNLDADRFIRIVLNEVDRAAQGWKKGDPRDETAFMSRLTEFLKRKSKNCDVGKASPMKVDSSTYVLHRKGMNQTDKYGADLAVTLDVSGIWRKTVIFQLKKSNGYKVRLNGDDLKSTSEDPLIAERSFVLAIDEERLGIRIAKVEGLNTKLQESGQKSMAFDTNDWHFLHDWITEWLRCGLAPHSPNDNSAGVEYLLDSFRVELGEDEEEYDYDQSNIRRLEFIPARVWLQTFVHEPKKQ
jgi:hypothetical protein